MLVLKSIHEPTFKILITFSAVVAVKPNQEKPLKIAIVVQSEPTEYWLIKVSQISCAEIKPFKGRKQHTIYNRNFSNDHIFVVIYLSLETTTMYIYIYIYYTMLQKIRRNGYLVFFSPTLSFEIKPYKSVKEQHIIPLGKRKKE